MIDNKVKSMSEMKIPVIDLDMHNHLFTKLL